MGGRRVASPSGSGVEFLEIQGYVWDWKDPDATSLLEDDAIALVVSAEKFD